MTDELKQWEYDKGYEKGKKDGGIEALRNLRAEIQDRADHTPYTNQLSVDAHNLDIDIINKHINRLKGENK